MSRAGTIVSFVRIRLKQPIEHRVGLLIVVGCVVGRNADDPANNAVQNPVLSRSQAALPEPSTGRDRTLSVSGRQITKRPELTVEQRNVFLTHSDSAHLPRSELMVELELLGIDQCPQNIFVSRLLIFFVAF